MPHALVDAVLDSVKACPTPQHRVMCRVPLVRGPENLLYASHLLSAVNAQNTDPRLLLKYSTVFHWINCTEALRVSVDWIGSHRDGVGVDAYLQSHHPIILPLCRDSKHRTIVSHR